MSCQSLYWQNQSRLCQIEVFNPKLLDLLDGDLNLKANNCGHAKNQPLPIARIEQVLRLPAAARLNVLHDASLLDYADSSRSGRY